MNSILDGVTRVDNAGSRLVLVSLGTQLGPRSDSIKTRRTRERFLSSSRLHWFRFPGPFREQVEEDTRNQNGQIFASVDTAEEQRMNSKIRGWVGSWPIRGTRRPTIVSSVPPVPLRRIKGTLKEPKVDAWSADRTIRENFTFVFLCERHRS